MAEDGILVPHPENHLGLAQAFELAAGKTDREVAQSLTSAGFRTLGTRGTNPFTKDTVRVMLQHRFYLGELADGPRDGPSGSTTRCWTTTCSNGRSALAPPTRRAPGRSPAPTSAAPCPASPCAAGAARIYCYQGRQTNKCRLQSLLLDAVERHFSAYVATFRIPEELVERVITPHKQAQQDRDNAHQRRQRRQVHPQTFRKHLRGGVLPIRCVRTGRRIGIVRRTPRRWSARWISPPLIKKGGLVGRKQK